MAVDRLFRELNQSVEEAKLKKFKEIERQAKDLLELYVSCIEKKIEESTPSYREFDQANYEFRRAYKDGRISSLQELKSIIGKGE